MSAAPQPAPRRRLVAVDGDTGEVVSPEVVSLHERLASAEQHIHDLEVDLRTKRAMITKLKKDKADERWKYERADDVRRVHAYWQAKLGHKKALTADRFDAVRAMIEETRYEIADGKAKKVPAFRWPEDFKLAVDGAAYDPFCKPMKNQKIQRYDDLATVFKSAKSMQMHIDRAPVRD